MAEWKGWLWNGGVVSQLSPWQQTGWWCRCLGRYRRRAPRRDVHAVGTCLGHTKVERYRSRLKWDFCSVFNNSPELWPLKNYSSHKQSVHINNPRDKQSALLLELGPKAFTNRWSRGEGAVSPWRWGWVAGRAGRCASGPGGLCSGGPRRDCTAENAAH